MNVETDDIQSLVFTGHGDQPASIALWLEATGDVAAAREGLCGLVYEDEVWFGRRERSAEPRLHLALSAAGLRALDAPGDQLEQLERPFRQGMVTPRRSRALGDRGRNDPAGWSWGDRAAHALLLIYAPTPDSARARAAALVDRLAPGWRPLHELAIHLPDHGREPFGFRDGIARTRIAWDGDGRDRPGLDSLPPGEVLLGHRDAVERVREVPTLAANGSYLVARQLEQDVAGFWRFWLECAEGDADSALWLASKAVGRWPNGMPIRGSSPSPEPAADEAAILAGPSFGDDPHGEHCPRGAHVRRSNPRDALTADAQRSRDIVALHRLHRRGRMYGADAPLDWYPQALRAALPAGGDAEAERGLLFMTLCGDIARQFEFVQQSWLAHPKFADLFDEVDAIAGGDQIPGDAGHLTIPQGSGPRALRRRLAGVKGWVTVRGGGYFLLPGRRAILDVLAP
ncbi:hypothetical protein [Engelhardtia mirabilis]|uniref:Dyp-type peroxidase n=1 Tax=Engelhardtia mirabilis TaxID=2528011 RepID=UPI0011A9D5FD